MLLFHWVLVALAVSLSPDPGMIPPCTSLIGWQNLDEEGVDSTGPRPDSALHPLLVSLLASPLLWSP